MSPYKGRNRLIKKRLDRFVANGRARILRSKEYRQKEAELRQEVWRKYEEEYAELDLIGRLLLRSRMRREVEEELERLAPRDAFYFRAR